MFDPIQRIAKRPRANPFFVSHTNIQTRTYNTDIALKTHKDIIIMLASELAFLDARAKRTRLHRGANNTARFRTSRADQPYNKAIWQAR